MSGNNGYLMIWDIWSDPDDEWACSGVNMLVTCKLKTTCNKVIYVSFQVGNKRLIHKAEYILLIISREQQHGYDLKHHWLTKIEI